MQNSQINAGLRKLGIMFTLICICKQIDSDNNDKTMMRVSQHFTRMKQDLKSSSIAGPLYVDLSQILSTNATALESLITSTSSIFARCNSCRSTSPCSSLLSVDNSIYFTAVLLCHVHLVCGQTKYQLVSLRNFPKTLKIQSSTSLCPTPFVNSLNCA